MYAASFLESAAGRIFCVVHQPAASHAVRGRVLLLPPFAEEMNKSRHVLAAIARAFAASDYLAILPDLFGTGDSEGDFADADLEIWRADVDRAVAALGTEGGLHIVGLRFGALLAADAARRHPVDSLSLLQPVADGRLQLNQMLRLRLASGMVGGGRRESSADLRRQLADGESIEIAGYGLSGRLAAQLETLALSDLGPGQTTRVHWLEIAAQADRELMPASQTVIEQWRRAGVSVDPAVIACDAFWATQELAFCPELAARVSGQIAGHAR